MVGSSLALQLLAEAVAEVAAGIRLGQAYPSYVSYTMERPFPLEAKPQNGPVVS